LDAIEILGAESGDRNAATGSPDYQIDGSPAAYKRAMIEVIDATLR
jgi:hypothetical protein